ncbi:MAG TPA: hypothetical protein VGJ68_06445 [Bradyrhizobium sp.]
MQPKAISFPTDAKLLHAAIKGLNRLAAKHGGPRGRVLPTWRWPLSLTHWALTPIDSLRFPEIP